MGLAREKGSHVNFKGQGKNITAWIAESEGWIEDGASTPHLQLAPHHPAPPPVLHLAINPALGMVPTRDLILFRTPDPTINREVPHMFILTLSPHNTVPTMDPCVTPNILLTQVQNMALDAAQYLTLHLLLEPTPNMVPHLPPKLVPKTPHRPQNVGDLLAPVIRREDFLEARNPRKNRDRMR